MSGCDGGSYGIVRRRINECARDTCYGPVGPENATAMAAAAATVSSAAATGTETTDGRKRDAVVEVLLRADDSDSERNERERGRLRKWCISAYSRRRCYYCGKRNKKKNNNVK